MTTPEQLRALVAEKVMGAKIERRAFGQPRFRSRRIEEWWKLADDSYLAAKDDWDPLESGADAWRVVERMQKLGWDIDMVCLGANTTFPNYDVHFTRTDAKGFREPTVGYADDPDPKRAISLAALSALGVEVE